MEEAAEYNITETHPIVTAATAHQPSLLDGAYNDTKAIYSLVGQAENQGWSAVHHQKNIVSEEFNEMLDGIDSEDADELLDGIGDSLFTLFGLAHRAGIDITDIIEKVVDYNWSKFCYTEEQLKKTIQKYDDLEIGTYFLTKPHPIHEDKTVMIVFSSRDQVDNQGKQYFEGKWLKSVDTVTPDLTFTKECRLV